MQTGLCHRRGAYATAFEKVPRACRRALVVLGHYLWTKRAIYMLARLVAVAMIISRARLGVIVCACMLAWDRRTSTVSNSQGCGAASAGWSSPSGQGMRDGALARFELLRMDGDETTSVERQSGRMQGLRVSHRRVMLSARAPGGVAGAEPRGAIVPSRSVCCDRARVLRLRCVGVRGVHHTHVHSMTMTREQHEGGRGGVCGVRRRP